MGGRGAPLRLGPFQIDNKVVLDLGDLQVPEPGLVRIRVRQKNGEEVVELALFLFDSTGHELGSLYPDETGTSSAPLTPGDYVAHAWARNGTTMRHPFTVRSGEETNLDLVLEPAVRRYVSFPVPEPDGWGEPKEVRFVIRDAGGRVFDDSYFEPRDFMPFRYMPAFAVGRYTLELTLDDGRRFQGVFGVPDLHPSDESITVSVTPIR